MSTVARKSVISSFSTPALISTTWAPWMSRTVWAASRTATLVASAKLCSDWPITLITFAMFAIACLLFWNPCRNEALSRAALDGAMRRPRLRP